MRMCAPPKRGDSRTVHDRQRGRLPTWLRPPSGRQDMSSGFAATSSTQP